MKPTEEQMERAVAALAPFVFEYRLPLNPEELHEMAYAVLLHHDSNARLDEIERASTEQIADARARHAEMLKSWQESTRRLREES